MLKKVKLLKAMEMRGIQSLSLDLFWTPFSVSLLLPSLTSPLLLLVIFFTLLKKVLTHLLFLLQNIIFPNPCLPLFFLYFTLSFPPFQQTFTSSISLHSLPANLPSLMQVTKVYHTSPLLSFTMFSLPITPSSNNIFSQTYTNPCKLPHLFIRQYMPSPFFHS